MSFLFAVLGSVIFWVVYAIVTVFAGTLMLKYTFPKTFKSIAKGLTVKEITSGNTDHAIVFMLGIISLYLFWPFLMVLVIIKFFLKTFSKVIWKGVSSMVMNVDKNLPEIHFKEKEE